MKFSNQFNTAHRKAYIPFAILLSLCVVAMVSIAANIAGTESGDGLLEDSNDAVLLIRDYPVFPPSETKTDSATGLTIEQATKQAWEWVQTGANSGQAHYYGYARGVLDPWWNQDQVSKELRILRATILQQQHQFEAALHDLNQVIEQDPLNVQAHFTRSAIYLASGDLHAALQDCRAVWLQADAVSVAICISQIKSLQGNSARMTELLTHLLEDNELSPLQRREMHTSLAELHWAEGKMELAKQHFALALLLSPQHSYVVAQYSMLLLQEKNYSALAALLEQQPATLENQIKLFAALQHLPHSDSTDLKNTIDASIAGISKDTPDTYTKALALYYQLIAPKPAAAVHFAQLNWQQQKGIADAILLLNATRQAEDQKAAEPVYQWIATQDVKNQRLEPIGALKNG